MDERKHEAMREAAETERQADERTRTENRETAEEAGRALELQLKLEKTRTELLKSCQIFLPRKHIMQQNCSSPARSFYPASILCNR